MASVLFCGSTYFHARRWLRFIALHVRYHRGRRNQGKGWRSLARGPVVRRSILNCANYTLIHKRRYGGGRVTLRREGLI